MQAVQAAQATLDDFGTPAPLGQDAECGTGGGPVVLKLELKDQGWGELEQSQS